MRVPVLVRNRHSKIERTRKNLKRNPAIFANTQHCWERYATQPRSQPQPIFPLAVFFLMYDNIGSTPKMLKFHFVV